VKASSTRPCLHSTARHVAAKSLAVLVADWTEGREDGHTGCQDKVLDYGTVTSRPPSSPEESACRHLPAELELSRAEPVVALGYTRTSLAKVGT